MGWMCVTPNDVYMPVCVCVLKCVSVCTRVAVFAWADVCLCVCVCVCLCAPVHLSQDQTAPDPVSEDRTGSDPECPRTGPDRSRPKPRGWTEISVACSSAAGPDRLCSRVKLTVLNQSGARLALAG